MSLAFQAQAVWNALAVYVGIAVLQPAAVEGRETDVEMRLVNNTESGRPSSPISSPSASAIARDLDLLPPYSAALDESTSFSSLNEIGVGATLPGDDTVCVCTVPPLLGRGYSATRDDDLNITQSPAVTAGDRGDREVGSTPSTNGDGIVRPSTNSSGEITIEISQCCTARAPPTTKVIISFIVLTCVVLLVWLISQKNDSK